MKKHIILKLIRSVIGKFHHAVLKLNKNREAKENNQMVKQMITAETDSRRRQQPKLKSGFSRAKKIANHE